MKKNVLVMLLSLILINSSYSQHRRFGLGIILGEPTGISAKVNTGFYNSLDFAAAWSFREDSHMLLQADYIWHNFDLVNVETGRLPFYYGIGGRIIFSNDPQVGVRVPVGLNYQFATAPVDIFVELVPILDFIPSTKFNFAVGLGARFWIN
jgi:hypothetical protein